MNIYERLRSIGVSIETADILAPVLERMPKRKQEAFVLWAMGYEQAEAARIAGVSFRTFKRLLYNVKVALL